MAAPVSYGTAANHLPHAIGAQEGEAERAGQKRYWKNAEFKLSKYDEKQSKTINPQIQVVYLNLSSRNVRKNQQGT